MTYNLTERDLDIKAKLTLPTGTIVNLTSAEIVSYTVNEEAAGSGYALGEAPAASYELIVDDTARSYSVLTLSGAKVEVQIGVLTDDAYVYSPLGVWTVESANLSKQSATATIKGSDALAISFNANWSDLAYPKTLGEIATAACSQAGVTLKSSTFLNSTVSISRAPNWPEGTTVRAVIGYVAACAGGFARIDRTGKLEIVTYNQGVSVGTITADTYMKLETGDGSEFNFNCLAVRAIDADEFTRYAIAEKADSAQNTLQIDGNPLLTTSAMCNTIKNALNGFSSAGLSVDWVGDPAVLLGDKLTIQDTDGTTEDIIINQQTLTFKGGLKVTSAAELATEEGNASGYVVNDLALNAAGMLRGGKLITQSVSTEQLAAGSVTAEQIAAGSVTTEKLGAESVTTEKLAAESVTADKVVTGSLDALIVTAMTAAFNALVAGDVQTSTLYASMAHVISLAADNIEAGTVDIDILATQLANISDARIASADIDFLKVKDLVTNTAIITEGVGGKLYISRLDVTEANIVNLSVGEFMVRGNDGQFYRVGVDEEGNILTELVSVTGENITDGSIGGKKLIENTITTREINAQNLFVDDAIIKQLIAANLDVGTFFARDATIDALKTADISGNATLSLYVKQDDLSTYLRLSEGKVELGETNSPVKVQLRTGENAGLYITEEGQANAYFGQNKARIERLEMGEAIIIGNTAIVAQDNGNDVFWLGR